MTKNAWSTRKKFSLTPHCKCWPCFRIHNPRRRLDAQKWKARSGAIKAQNGAVDAHNGGMEAQNGAVKGSPLWWGSVLNWKVGSGSKLKWCGSATLDPDLYTHADSANQVNLFCSFPTFLVRFPCTKCPTAMLISTFCVAGYSGQSGGLWPSCSHCHNQGTGPIEAVSPRITSKLSQVWNVHPLPLYLQPRYQLVLILRMGKMSLPTLCYMGESYSKSYRLNY